MTANTTRVAPPAASPPAPGMDRFKQVARNLLRTWRGGVLVILLIMLAWESLARSGLFNELFVPTVGQTAAALVTMASTGLLWTSLQGTIFRLLTGFGLAVLLGVPIGLAMGRSKVLSEILQPLVNLLLPIPAIAWIPLFMLWFGLGNSSIIPLIILSAALPIAINTWAGVRFVSGIWLRAATGMGIRGRALFQKVILPASLPLMLSGLRVGMAQGWRAVIAGELIASAQGGLGVVIFNAKQFINTPIILATLVVIGIFSQIFEKLVFGRLEKATVGRWGMLGSEG